MTSGLPLAAALPRRAGTLVPPSVAAVLSLPVSLVFVGTVLLSVVLGTAEFVRFRSATASGEPTTKSAPWRATVSHRPDKAPRATLRGRAVTRANTERPLVFPGRR